MGLNLFDNCAGGGAFWIHRYCCCGCGYRQIAVLPFPGDLPGTFYSRHIRRQKNTVRVGTQILKAWWEEMWAGNAGCGEAALVAWAIRVQTPWRAIR